MLALPDPIDTEWESEEGYMHEKSDRELVRELIYAVNQILVILKSQEPKK